MRVSEETTEEIRAIAAEKGCRLLALESAGADEGARSGGAGKIALRVGMVAASLALFAGAWSLTNSSPFADASGQSVPPSQIPQGNQHEPTPGTSGITATPVPIVPNATTGVS